MQSFKKKIKTLLKNGIDPVIEGIYNFNNLDLDIDFLAIDRSKECIFCDMFVDEPIDFLKVTDKNIPELSGKMCDECGCTLSYKLRQSISKCEKWQD